MPNARAAPRGGSRTPHRRGGGGAERGGRSSSAPAPRSKRGRADAPNPSQTNVLLVHGDWVAKRDPNTGKVFYGNRTTKETTWVAPPGFPVVSAIGADAEATWGQGEVLSEQEYAQIEEVFTDMDKNHDGSISRSELHEALKNKNRDLTEDEFDKLWRSLDADGNGAISEAEFRAREEKAMERMKNLYADMTNTYEQCVTQSDAAFRLQQLLASLADFRCAYNRGRMMRGLFFYLFFTLIYFYVIFMQLKIEGSFDVEDGLKQALLGMETVCQHSSPLHTTH